MWLVVGLGNPGARYEQTPHNMGFLAVDRLAEASGIRISQPDSKALVGKGLVKAGQAEAPAILAKPQTFMNLSGTSVKALLAKYELAPPDLLLVYDELALEWGSLRVRPKGSSAGHNGVQNVIDSLGTDEFARIRLGIRPDHLAGNIEYVLSPMRGARKEALDSILDTASRAMESVMTEGVDKAMAKYNRRAQGLKEEE